MADIKKAKDNIDEMETIQMLNNEKTNKSRSEIQHQYYLNHKWMSHRNTLLFDVKRKGRVPNLHSVKKYDIKIEELVKNFKIFKENNTCKELKLMKFQALVLNMI